VTGGSGSIDIKSCKIGKGVFESGSGSITIQKSEGDITAYAGSGRVHLEDIDTSREVNIQTGSGSCRLKGDFSALVHLFIQTGSGNITLISTPFPKLAFDISTGSGQISIEVPNLYTGKPLSRTFKGSIGDEKDHHGVIRTGSGNVRLATNVKKNSASGQTDAEKH
jgi:DUF4097 and DUF4098 domain-containing protein YvlB